jgi:predicted RNA-binding Zn-ribbon protein involved in translation (DUF1610 family)
MYALEPQDGFELAAKALHTVCLHIKVEEKVQTMTTGRAHKCPKCGAEMKSGTTSGDFRILKQGDLVGDRANAFYCSDCGFVELYKEPSTREPRRLRAPPPEIEQAPPSGEPQKSQEEEPKRRTDKRLVR